MIPKTAVILAAGDGGRIADLISYPKLLIEYKGKTLLEHHLYGLAEYGVTEFLLVLGWQAEAIRTFIRENSLDDKFGIVCIDNPDWYSKENGYSAYLGLEEVKGDDCFLIMGDHFFDYGFLNTCNRVVTEQETMIDFIDSEMSFMKPEWCTKALDKAGYVIQSGKNIVDYSSLDIGLFILNAPIVLKQMTSLISAGNSEWNDTVIFNIKHKKIIAFDIGNHFWHGVNNPEQYYELLNR